MQTTKLLISMKITEKTILEVDYKDLDDAITEFLNAERLKAKGSSYTFLNGRGYESVAENDWINDSSYGFSVTGELTKLERQIIEKGAFDGLNTASILNWMCNLGFIKPGEYLVNARW